MSSTRPAAAVAAALLLGACAEEAGAPLIASRVDPAAPAWNYAVQAGLPPDPGALVALQEAFARAAPAIVTFDTASARLSPQAEAAAAAQAAWLRSHPDAVVRLTGHADARGGAAFNARLGLRRAEAVAEALVERGVPLRQIGRVVSAGEAGAFGASPVFRRVETDVVRVGAAPAGRPRDAERALRLLEAWRAGRILPPETEAMDQ